MKTIDKKSRVLLWIVALLSSALPQHIAVAQENESEARKKPRHVFYATTWGEWQGEPLFAKLKSNTYRQIAMHHLAKSEAIPFQPGKGITLYRKTQDSSGEKDIYVAAMLVQVPVTMRIPLLLITRANGKLRSKLYDISPENFPGGSYRFVNISRQPIFLTAGSKRHRIHPGKEYLIKDGFGDKKLVKLAAYIPGSGGNYRRVWSVDSVNRKNKRLTMFFYPVKTMSGKLTLRSKSMADYLYTDNNY